MDPEKQKRIDEATEHPYECCCAKCKEWWAAMPPEDDHLDEDMLRQTYDKRQERPCEMILSRSIGGDGSLGVPSESATGGSGCDG